MAGGEPKKSDLGVRTASAVVMVAVAGTALWLGGWVWTVFVASVALGVLWEWRGLVVGFEPSPVKRGLWNAGGLVYVGLATFHLAWLRPVDHGLGAILAFVVLVMAVDVGAYFAGRTFGGPKIAPSISPSKTWAGFLGGSIAAGMAFAVLMNGTCIDANIDWNLDCLLHPDPMSFIIFVPCGFVVAIVAQAGDFFESWMKRRAGVKDSGVLLPGHGGLFDRLDGLLAVVFVMAVLSAGRWFS